MKSQERVGDTRTEPKPEQTEPKPEQRDPRERVVAPPIEREHETQEGVYEEEEDEKRKHERH